MELLVNQDSIIGDGDIHILCLSGIEPDELIAMIEFCFVFADDNYEANKCEITSRLGGIIKIVRRLNRNAGK